MKSSQSHGLGHDEVARVDFNYFLSYFFSIIQHQVD